MSFSKREIEEFRPKVDRVVEKFLGFHEPALVETALHCLGAGYDKRKTAEKLSSLLDSVKAEKLAEKVLSVNDGRADGSRDKASRKRQHDPDHPPAPSLDSKKHKISSDDKPSDNKSDLTPNDIKTMMANAQKMIEERKKALSNLKGTGAGVPPAQTLAVAATGAAASKATAASKPSQETPKPVSDDKAKKIALLQEQIQSKLSSGVLTSMLAPASEGALPVNKPTPLILDSEGRTVDSSGREVQLTHVAPTLKANIRAKKREEFKAQMQERPVEESTTTNKYFDPRLSHKSSQRGRRSFRFNEPGKFQQMADRMRMKAQLQKLQGEISQIAKKTGITSATKLAQIAPKVHSDRTEIPDIEWWDSVILEHQTYGGGGGEDRETEGEESEPQIKEDSITNLVEHPTQMKPPTQPLKQSFLPVYLTKKERKKLRRQNRREAWKEEQEKIRLGLIAPPEPKLRISNLMRVLGTEAVQDPTKMEAHVKAQMAKRAKAHEDANQARKLTVEQRRDKRRRKIVEDTTFGVHVSVYRVRDLSNPSKKFKVEMNAKQLTMTGGVIMFKDCNVIIAEGGPKQQDKFKRLMTHRIKWEEDNIKCEGSWTDSPNQCTLVWEGMVKQRNFGEIKFKVCATEKLAREQLRKHGVEHYWDLAYSAAVLETEEK